MKNFKLFFEDDFMSGMDEYEVMTKPLYRITVFNNEYKDNIDHPKTISARDRKLTLANVISQLGHHAFEGEIEAYRAAALGGVGVGECSSEADCYGGGQYMWVTSDRDKWAAKLSELLKKHKAADFSLNGMIQSSSLFRADENLNEDDFMSGMDAYEQEYRPLYRVEKHHLVQANRNRVFVSQEVWQDFKKNMLNDVIDQLQQTGHCHTRTFGSKTITVSISYFLNKEKATNYINSIPNAEIIDKKNVMDRPIDETED